LALCRFINSTDGGKFAHLSSGLGNERSISAYILGTKGRILLQEEFFFQATKVTAYDFDNHVLATFEGPFLKMDTNLKLWKLWNALEPEKKRAKRFRWMKPLLL